MTPPYDAVVLAGGRSRRMNGGDKTQLPVGGQPLLERVLGAVAGAQRIVVVGPQRQTLGHVIWAQEQPPGGGPAAAVAAGLVHVQAETVAVLAGDLPFVTAEDVSALVARVGPDDDGCCLVDDDDREQWLCGAWRTTALRALDLSAGGSLGAALGGLRVHRWSAPAAGPPPYFDCDTPDELRIAKELLP